MWILLSSRLTFFLLVVGMTMTTPCLGQDRLDKQHWKEKSEGLDYSKEKEVPEEDLSYRGPSSFFSDITVFRYILVILVIGALAFIIYKLQNSDWSNRNSKVDKEVSTQVIDRIEENLMEANLDDYLAKALADENYPLAIRILYLRVIQHLSKNHYIVWKKDKTNLHYIEEMANFQQQAWFKSLTRIFEQAWYGEQVFVQGAFEKARPEFERFLEGTPPQKRPSEGPKEAKEQETEVEERGL